MAEGGSARGVRLIGMRSPTAPDAIRWRRRADPACNIAKEALHKLGDASAVSATNSRSPAAHAWGQAVSAGQALSLRKRHELPDHDAGRPGRAATVPVSH